MIKKYITKNIGIITIYYKVQIYFNDHKKDYQI